MAIEMHCGNCDTQLRAADSAAGRHAKCPECGFAVQFPRSDEHAAGSSATQSFGHQQLAGRTASTPDRSDSQSSAERPCPMCGTMIKSIAVRCRFCGEDVSKVFGNPMPSQLVKRQSMTAAVLGISALILFCFWFYSVPVAIVAIVVGGKEIGASKGRGEEAGGMSVTGVVCGVVVIGVWILLIALFLFGAFVLPGF